MLFDTGKKVFVDLLLQWLMEVVWKLFPNAIVLLLEFHRDVFQVFFGIVNAFEGQSV